MRRRRGRTSERRRTAPRTTGVATGALAGSEVLAQQATPLAGRFSIGSLPVGAALVDGAGQVLEANEDFARLIGRPRRDLAGSILAELIHPDDRIVARRWTEDGDGPDHSAVRFAVGEHWVTALVDYQPLGRAVSGAGLLVASDLTAQARAEARARIRGQILDQVDAAVVATDLEGRIIEWSHGAERLYGVSNADAIGAHPEDLAALPRDQAQTRAIVEAVLAAGSWSGRVRSTRPDGAEVTAYTRNALLHDAEGNPAGMVGIAVDITGQIEAEHEAIRARNYLNAVTDQLVEGIYVVDEANGLTYMNGTAERLLGHTAADLAGCNLHEVLHHTRPDGTPYPIEECPITAVREGRARTHVEPEDIFYRADGTPMPVSFSAAAFESPEGARGVAVVFRDITREKAERDRMRNELEAMSWVGPIRDALADDTLILHGQPIIDLTTREVVQQELLLRLPGADGPVAAGRFLPAAERFDMIGEIDRWVIVNAIDAAAALGEPVQFNLSAASIEDPSTPLLIEERIAATGIDPASVVIEVTESSVISEAGIAERFARRLVGDGCRLALDDFGTGYGGFTYLTSLNVSILKIDRTFVADLSTDDSSRSVVKAVVGLAEEFGLTTVAEGVEDADTLEMLAGLGVDQAQGYHIGRPAPLTKLPADHKFLDPKPSASA